MEKYIEAIIEIVLDNVSCHHQEIEEYPRGPKFDDPTYSLGNEKEVIKKCLKLKSGPQVTEEFVGKWWKKFKALQVGKFRGLTTSLIKEMLKEAGVHVS